LLTLITGVAYPLLVTGIAQAVFLKAANGSLIVENGKMVGSSLIGQPVDDARYFWGRPSATSPYPNNATSSSGSNLGPTNKALMDAIQGRIDAYRKADPTTKAPIPTELVTASASGLDPHISPAGAQFQVARVARVRNVTPEAVEAIVKKHTTDSLLGIIGEPVVNVLEVNLEMDKMKSGGAVAQTDHN